ncbi:hypothetical protein QCA50_016007 [Cerrena zonata]|uniref:Uncharacterized protein n=1 Tax=Cerrena zonata TaxID=2478898 RepID=A0AAW0FN30_9APHY
MLAKCASKPKEITSRTLAFKPPVKPYSLIIIRTRLERLSKSGNKECLKTAAVAVVVSMVMPVSPAEVKIVRLLVEH